MRVPRLVGAIALVLATMTTSVPLGAEQTRTGQFSGDYLRLQLPELFTYDELVTLSQPDPLPPAIEAKLRTLQTTPFLSNEAFYRGARPHRVSLFTIDRSFGRGPVVDRLFLRRHLAPRAEVAFSSRRADEAGAAGSDAGQTAPTLELLRDGEAIDAWPLGGEWREFRASVPVAAVPAERSRDWPRTTTLLRWRLRGAPSSSFELRDISVALDSTPRD